MDVYCNHRQDLVDYATPIIGCRNQAEDIVQDAFLRFLPEKNSRPPKKSGLAYLYKTVRNLAIDFIRRSAMENRHQSSGNIEWLNPGEAPSPELVNQRRTDLDAITNALSQLPEKERIAVEMHRIGGYTLQEIAHHLNVSVATAHRLLRNGLIKVVRALNDYDLI